MNDKFYLVSEIINEGFGTFYTKTLPHAMGRGTGKVAKFFGGTPEKMRHQKRMHAAGARMFGIHPKTRKMNEFEVGMMKGLK